MCGPFGTLQPGEIGDIPAEYAQAIVSVGAAELVDSDYAASNTIPTVELEVSEPEETPETRLSDFGLGPRKSRKR
jgi:hypothetical protein